ncbi:MAG TPA: hypothetical protein VG650_04155 [Mycobacteriales bacterium]|nr:hypothetical protein [Mycobacteriales bacterium]
MTISDLGPIVEVRLLQLPVQVWARTQAHTDELLREFLLVAQQLRHEESAAGSVPRRLIHLVEELSGSYGSFSEDQEARLFDAAAAGEVTLDLTYQVPALAGEAARHLGDMLNEADEYCRSGEHLLTLETPAELVRFREWFLEEFRRQIAGEPPTPWPDLRD